MITGPNGAGGTIMLALPPSVPVKSCSNPCLGPTTLQISHTLTGFAQLAFNVFTSPNCQQATDSSTNSFVSPGALSCSMSQLPITSSGGTEIHLSVRLRVAGRSYVDMGFNFFWVPTTCPASKANSRGAAPRQIAFCTLDPDLVISKMVVMQASQTPHEFVTLAANKDTIVRVFIKVIRNNPLPLPVAGVSAKLQCFDVGTQVWGGIPFNATITAQPLAEAPDPELSVPDLADETVNFILPATCTISNSPCLN